MEDETEMKINGKEAVSPVIGVILMVAITVVLAAVLYVWVSSMTPTGGGTPYCTLSASTSGTGAASGADIYTQVNVTWMVSSPSRADIKWSDVPNASAKYLDDGVVITAVAVTYPDGIYITGGDIITATLNRATVVTGSSIRLVLVHVPSGGTLADSAVTLSYTADT